MRFIRETSLSGINAKLHLYKMGDISLGNAGSVRDYLATVTWIILVIDVDLNALSATDISAVKMIFEHMQVDGLRVTFEMKGAANVGQLPMSAIRSLGTVDVNGQRGWVGHIDLHQSFADRLTTVNSLFVCWRTLSSCADNTFVSLTIRTYAEGDFNRFCRLMLLIESRRFDLQWLDKDHKLVAGWQKVQTTENGEVKESLVVNVITLSQLDLLEQYLRTRKPSDFDYIAIVTDKAHDLFVRACEVLRLALEKFAYYTVHETKECGVGANDVQDVNRIDIQGAQIYVKLATGRHVSLPKCERFTKIDLDFEAPFQMHWAEAELFAMWLASCTIAEELRVVDQGASILDTAIMLVARDILSDKGRLPFLLRHNVAPFFGHFIALLVC